MDTRFDEIMQRLQGETYSGYLTGKGNFRLEAAKLKGYKANRIQEKPFHYKNIRDYLIAKYGAVVVNGIEADDAVAIEATSNPSAIIVSRDKDLLQVPNIVYGYACGKSPEKFMDVENGIDCAWFFFKQVLTGDTTDNYSGIPGVGPVKADKILSGCETVTDMFNKTLFAYVEHYGADGPAMYLEQATLAWMVREMKDGQPVLPTLEAKFYEHYYPQ